MKYSLTTKTDFVKHRSIFLRQELIS